MSIYIYIYIYLLCVVRIWKLQYVGMGEESSVRGDFWASSVEVLVYRSPTSWGRVSVVPSSMKKRAAHHLRMHWWSGGIANALPRAGNFLRPYLSLRHAAMSLHKWLIHVDFLRVMNEHMEIAVHWDGRRVDYPGRVLGVIGRDPSVSN